MNTTDTYKTITEPGEEVLFKDKNSKFFGYSFPIISEEEVKSIIESLKKQHHAARHWCYAWQLGTENIKYRSNDDGEPSNSAGQPIYGQIQSFQVTNILIVVVRYFGGVKLGVGGLINAYRTAAQLSLQSSNILEKTIDIKFCITFEYKNMNKVMRIIKERQLKITNQKLELDCKIFISVRKTIANEINDLFSTLYEVEIKRVDD
ncbi:YigZ family protein [Aquimarina sp. AD1]|uniref:IMPACT family protein n=1 Tax=Aquimarina sp. (strain AD1) TaxID=1714848 RepID=UPI000E473315|nr:YigZ family protein [Aquimarina sp. AD1]AXT54774.1 YigZ family protein [Aquimarina sp. AD1]RKN15935.1 YigZ family protein [Aquimarina sp. AD1]